MFRSSGLPETGSAIDWVEEASLESFPASDAPSWVTGEDWQAKFAIGNCDRLAAKGHQNGLRARQLIPPLTLRQRGGDLVRAWDFKQEKNLVIAFLDVGCSSCEAFIRALTNQAAEFREREAVTLLVFPRQPEQSMRDIVSDELFAGAASPHDVQAFVGEDALSTEQLSRRGVFVTDRYGEISGLWTTQEHGFPRIEEILGALNLVEIACEECSVPIWPVDE